MDGPGFGGMNRLGGGMYKHLFFCVYPPPFLVNEELYGQFQGQTSHGFFLLAHFLKDASRN